MYENGLRGQMGARSSPFVRSAELNSAEIDKATSWEQSQGPMTSLSSGEVLACASASQAQATGEVAVDASVVSVACGSGDGPDLRRMLCPASIAIIGASDDSATLRGRTLEYLLQREYRGDLYLISTTRPEIRGRKTFASLRNVPGPIDLALIAVRADAVQGVLEDCAAVGARFAICFSSGFAEGAQEGVRLQRDLAELVKRGGPRICGPNSAGFFNMQADIPATFARNVDARRATAAPTRRSGPGTVAIIAQSGGLGFAMNDRHAIEHGLRVNYIVSTGNEVDLQVLDFVDFAAADPDIRVIVLLVEAIKEGTRLPAIALRALTAGKPVVAAKLGRTSAGRRAAGSHSARLTGSDDVYEAVLRRHGIVRVDDEDAVSDLAAAFSLCHLPAGRRVGILTTSGGAGVWMADACEAAGLSVPLLDARVQAALAAYVPSYGATHNPVDLTAQVTVNPLRDEQQGSPLVETLRALLDSETLDSVVLIANMSDGELLRRERGGLAAVAKELRKPLFLYSHAPPSRASLDLVQELGLLCLASTRRVARTIAHMADYADMRSRLMRQAAAPAAPISPVDQARLAGGLCEYEAKALLARYGVAVTTERLARSADEAVAAFAGFAHPVALKIQSRQIPHKTELGGVVLNVTTAEQVRSAYEEILGRARGAVPGAAIDGVLVQKMLMPGRELALGIVQDPDFGPMMMVGMGGIHIEAIKDVALEPLPVGRENALAMLQRLRAWPLLRSERGKPGADIDALIRMMERLSLLAEGARGACREIDLNPVFVYDEGRGATVVDALVVGRDEPTREGQPL